ncbi:DUF4268 domain-containing protein [Blastococcus capsensis]|uniref:DUF4268 domain-containing protein n=1 Tax=Blastococcus capsensis TaxID=1564163 RepID=UPI00254083EB|nr:DUF4268 domain-containing protein [Blastococcus capsensis]MDK3256748.1 DUF4268 domain-containing protein [Blastococcus capsensis]
MELDSKGLGRLRRVANARDVWTSESGDFTPWLAENLDVLADELGLSFTSVVTEVPVGEFRLDIEARTPDGRVVIVENQLERTDHGHLGQLLVYASGLEAAAVVWVAPQFRDDHRRTLDWLNERTDTGVDFFGVEVSVVQIGETGPRAPVFEVVARPNGWQKGVKGVGGSAASGAQAGGVNALRQDFYAEVLTSVVAARPAVRMPTRGTQNWISFAAGPWGYWSLSVALDGRLRIEAYIDTGDASVNKALFDELRGNAQIWEEKVGQALSWERLDDKRASRIAAYRAVTDLSDPAERATLKAWTLGTILGLYDAMNDCLRTRARQLRDAINAQEQVFGPEATDGTLSSDDQP